MSQAREGRAATMTEKMPQAWSSFKHWLSRITYKPLQFAVVEIVCISAVLGLVYYIDVHRGPVFRWPKEDDHYEEDARRNLRIRREVAGLGPAPHHDSTPAAAPAHTVSRGFSVGDCSACADWCSNNPNCLSYDCDREDKMCKPKMKPPGPSQTKCSSVEFDFIEGGRTVKTKSFRYDCEGTGTKKGGKGDDRHRPWWDLWGLPSRHPGATAVFVMVLLFYAICSWAFVFARSNDSRMDIGFPAMLAKATVTLLGAVGGAALLALALAMAGALLALMSSLATRKGVAGAAGRVANMTLDFSLGIGAVALVYVLFAPIIDKHTRGPYARLIKNAILYVPCLLIDVSQWLVNEWKIAPHSAWVLLGIEVVLVGIRVLWPIAERALVNHDGKQLLREPVYLSIPRGLGTFEDLHQPTDGSKPHFKYSFGLSAWFNLNPQPPNTRAAFSRFTPILDYGGKPTVEFNMKTGTLKVKSEAGEGTVTVAEATGVAMQTWNNIVINYDAGTMDVFLNGELIGTHPNISPFMQFESVTAGHRRGLEGGICNVVYHPDPLSQGRVRMGYKMLRDRRPPVS